MSKNKRPTFEEFRKEMLKDPRVKAEYEALRPEFEALEKRIRAKIKKINRMRIFKKK